MCDEAVIAKTDYISKEQFYKMCHISKKTALKLIQNGTIPAIDTGKPTCRYYILRQDAEEFLKWRQTTPERYSSLAYAYCTYNITQAIRLSSYLQVAWESLPDILTVSEVTEVTGYQKGAVYKWCNTGDLFSLLASRIRYIPKKSLISFLCSKKRWETNPKSDLHIELIRSAINECDV